MKIIKKVLIEIEKVPRWIGKQFYIRWNKLMFWANEIKYGKNILIYNRFYLQKDRTATISIGDNFVFTSGEAFNPLSRNQRGCIHAANKACIKIGDNVGISSAVIWAHSSISIGNNVNIGADCIILDTDAHSLNWRLRRKEMNNEFANSLPIAIEDDVLIGVRCIILKGVTIGARSIIAAGSVVTKSIPPDCIAGGIPCKIIKKS